MGIEKTTIEKGQFGVSVDTVKKIVKLSFGGFFNEDSQEFMNQYENAKKTVGQSTATLYLDGTELAVFPQKYVPMSEMIYLDYAKFKEIYIICPKSITAKAQLIRTLEKINVKDKFNFVDKFPA